MPGRQLALPEAFGGGGVHWASAGSDMPRDKGTRHEAARSSNFRRFHAGTHGSPPPRVPQCNDSIRAFRSPVGPLRECHYFGSFLPISNSRSRRSVAGAGVLMSMQALRAAVAG